MILKKTSRGFNFVEFEDFYGTKCSIQESSLATDYAIWFGTNEDSMHLTQEQVEKLLPLLQNFIKTGYLDMED